MKLIELDEATVRRGGVPVLDRVSLSIGTGEHTAIVGPNGSGKSTLIKLLTCQIYPLAGADGGSPVRIFGRDRWNVAELRSHLGIISTDVHQRFVSGSSLGHVTGLDAVVASFFASEVIFLHHEVRPEMRARAAAALVRVDAEELSSKRMHEMSTGEVRRVLIARALVHEPEALILDEPTTGLDVVARAGFLAQLRKLARSGTTIVLVTHHVEEIVPEIGRVVLLSGGRVSASGATAEILTSERLSDAYGSSVSVRRTGDSYELRATRDGRRGSSRDGGGSATWMAPRFR